MRPRGLPSHMSQMQELRRACAAVAARARYVHIDEPAVPAYAASLPLDAPPPPDPAVPQADAAAEQRAALWLTLDASNFRSGWFPTPRKQARRSGSHPVPLG